MIRTTYQSDGWSFFYAYKYVFLYILKNRFASSTIYAILPIIINRRKQVEEIQLNASPNPTNQKMSGGKLAGIIIYNVLDKGYSLVLTKFRAEVKKLSIFEYNARLHEETLKKEGFEDGREQILWNALQKGHTPEQIADFIGIPLEEILKVQESMFQTSPSK